MGSAWVAGGVLLDGAGGLKVGSLISHLASFSAASSAPEIMNKGWVNVSQAY